MEGQDTKKTEFNKQNIGQEENISGSTLEGEEKELRKYDDWHAHKYEHNRDLKAEYREGELHGVVGKEIHDALKCEKQNQSNLQQGEFSKDKNVQQGEFSKDKNFEENK